MRHFSLTLTWIAVVLIAAGSLRAQVGPVYSLDDNPAMPITSPPGPMPMPGFGAEDPYGMALIPPPGLAPSPSLPAVFPMPAVDQGLLIPAPVPMAVPAMHLPSGGPGYWDAVSDNAFKPAPGARIHLAFSVDRVSMGFAGTAVGMEAMFNQQPGDIYHTDMSFTHPAAFVGTMPLMPGYNVPPLSTAFTGNSNLMLFDDSQLGLTAGMGPGVPIAPGVPAPPIQGPSGGVWPGTHDNLDALNWKFFDTNGDYFQDRWLFMSTPPDAAMMGAGMPADVMDLQPGGVPLPGMFPYAPAPALGLVAGPGPPTTASDCIDALIVWDANIQGGPWWGGPGAEPMVDYALFSLAPGSTSLWQFGLSEADIFFTNFTGAFWLYADASDLGLIGISGPAIGDNVDALEMMHPGDANLDYCVDGLDYVIWSNNYKPFGGGNNWLQGDFNGDGVVDGLDYVVWSNNYWSGCPSIPAAVPEPASAVLLVLGILAIRRRRYAA